MRPKAALPRPPLPHNRAQRRILRAAVELLLADDELLKRVYGDIDIVKAKTLLNQWRDETPCE